MLNLAFSQPFSDEADDDIVGGWADFARSIVIEDVPPSGVDAEQATAVIDTIRSGGWLTLPLEVGFPTLAEIVRVTHRRPLPLPAPLVEHFVAARFLKALGLTDALEANTGKDGAPSAMLTLEPETMAKLLGSSVQPQSSWTPFGNECPALSFAAIRSGNDGTVSAAVVLPSAGAPLAHGCPDVTLRVTERGMSMHDEQDARSLGVVPAESVRTAALELLVLQSAALVGQAEGLLQRTAEYLTVRRQFGVPIGSFQAIKHRLVDCATDVYASAALVRRVARITGVEPYASTASEVSRLALAAKSFSGRAALRLASESLQLHGGIGFTWEGNVHFSLSRIAFLNMSLLPPSACEDALLAQLLDTPDHDLWPTIL